MRVWASFAVARFELWTASVTAELLRALGMEVAQRSTVLVHPSGFGYDIDYPCTSLFPALVLAAMLALLPSARSFRAGAIVLGILLVTALNFARLVGLFFIGVHEPELFSLAHDIAGRAALVLFLGGYVFLCARWGRRPVYNEGE